MPRFGLSFSRRYNSLRLLGYDYNSTWQLCAIALVTDLRRPVIDWHATLRPEVVELMNWPHVKPEHFLRKRLWQTRIFDHVIRNDFDLEENLRYIAMNPVHEGYVTVPQFYPYTAFM